MLDTGKDAEECAALWLKEVYRISALISGFEAVRAPGRALEPGEVPAILADAERSGKLQPHCCRELGQAIPKPVLVGMAERIALIGSRLTKVLTDSVYVNDDRDREVVRAQLDLSRELNGLNALMHEAGISVPGLAAVRERHRESRLAGF